jgi:hypothetical protein
MTDLNNMYKSSRRGILLSIVLLFSIMLILIPSDVYAKEINVKSTSLEETTILEVTNNSNKEIDMLRIWLANDFNFQSFKTEKGWIGEKTPQGVIVFTSSESIKLGEIVKFGIKTDKPNPGVNWKVLDKDTNQIDIGKTLPEKLSVVIQNPDIISNQIDENYDPILSSESTFTIIPENPSIGSTIRVVGDKFQPSQTFDFYINTEKIGNFSTDVNGYFITTMKIPEDPKYQRVDFRIIKNDNQINTMSLRLNENINFSSESQKNHLSIIEIPSILHRGDNVNISGTGKANSIVIIEFAMLGKEVISSKTAEVNNKGIWKLDKPITMALDAEFGKYSIKISDGNENLMKQWDVESDKIIKIKTSNIKYELGDMIKLNGEVLPNIPIEINIFNPAGQNIHTDIIQIDDSGQFEFEEKISQSSMKGTYKINVIQKNESEVIFVGVGQVPKIPIIMSFDKINYKSTDKVVISLVGEEFEIVELLIIDPSNNQKGEDISIQLQGDGKNTYELDLNGYTSGVYTAVISKGSTETKGIFTVGLQTGSKEIQIQTTKITYSPGEQILILGDTTENIIINIIMMDSNGNKIKEKETYSNKDGKIAESSFVIPNDAKPGIWKIGAKSGSNFKEIEIEIISKNKEGIQLSINDGITLAGGGKTIQMIITGTNGTVEVKIMSSDDVIIDELSFTASDNGEVNVPWIIPKYMTPGIYTIIAKDSFNSVQNTFEVS